MFNPFKTDQSKKSTVCRVPVPGGEMHFSTSGIIQFDAEGGYALAETNCPLLTFEKNYNDYFAGLNAKPDPSSVVK
ncbi:MAG: hypothetical protein WC624_03485 [Candidatus Margulisiibacteriota bacterium]